MSQEESHDPSQEESQESQLEKQTSQDASQPPLQPCSCRRARAVGSARDLRLVRREGRGLVVRRQPPAMDGGEHHREVDEHRKPWSLHRPVKRVMTKLWCKGAWNGGADMDLCGAQRPQPAGVVCFV